MTRILSRRKLIKKRLTEKKVGPDDLIFGEKKIAKACGVGRWTITAIRAASRGQPDCPWSGRFTTVRRIQDWIFNHPEFRAYKVLRKPKATAGAVTESKVA